MLRLRHAAGILCEGKPTHCCPRPPPPVIPRPKERESTVLEVPPNSRFPAPKSGARNDSALGGLTTSTQSLRSGRFLLLTNGLSRYLSNSPSLRAGRCESRVSVVTIVARVGNTEVAGSPSRKFPANSLLIASAFVIRLYSCGFARE